MEDELLRTLPLAVTAAVNPTGICVLIAVLSRSRSTAAAVAASFTVFFIAVGVVFLAFGLNVSGDSHKTVSAIIDLAAAALLLFLAVRCYIKGRQKEKAAQTDQKKRTPRRLGFVGGLIAGLVLAVTDVSSLLPYIVAIKDWSRSSLGGLDVSMLDALFLIIAMAPMLVPVAISYAAPHQADRLLGPVNRALTKHGNTIAAVVLFAITVYLAVKGARAL